MKLPALRNPETWERHATMLGKRLNAVFRPACHSRGVFVLGKQRSGTSMLMHAFHRHPGMLVFDEHRSNKAFDRYRIRSFDVIRDLLEQSRFTAVCFKPICDSHKIADLHRAFPDGRFIWMYRDYRDVANSSLHKFGHSVRAVRLVCTGQPGGGWFQEGVSPRVSDMLRKVYRPDLTDFDLACLTWWARNQIIVESALIGSPNVTVVKYEALVSRPEPVLNWLFGRMDVEYRERVARHMSPRSIGRHKAPDMDSTIRRLCTDTLHALDDAYASGDPPPVSRIDAGSTH